MPSSVLTRRFLLALAILSLAACSKTPPAPPSAPPETPSETSPVAISDFGTYHAIITSSGDWSKNQPVVISSMQNLVHSQTTASIPGRPGVYWGLRDTISNGTNQPMQVLTVIRHPPITTPDGKTTTHEDTPDVVPPGKQLHDVSIWFFIERAPYEFVPGEWTWEISVDGKLQAQKSFQIFKP